MTGIPFGIFSYSMLFLGPWLLKRFTHEILANEPLSFICFFHFFHYCSLVSITFFKFYHFFLSLFLGILRFFLSLFFLSFSLSLWISPSPHRICHILFVAAQNVIYINFLWRRTSSSIALVKSRKLTKCSMNRQRFQRNAIKRSGSNSWAMSIHNSNRMSAWIILNAYLLVFFFGRRLCVTFIFSLVTVKFL